MPLKVVCKNCGYILGERNDILWEYDPVTTIREENDGKCPNCGRKLGNERDVNIMPNPDVKTKFPWSEKRRKTPKLSTERYLRRLRRESLCVEKRRRP